jgi:hypothetical protein
MDRRARNNGWSNSEPKTRLRRAYRAPLAASVLAIFLCVAIVCTASPTQAVTALNVRAFGATGNGRTDDTQAFTRAMRAAVNARATLYVPRGTYKMRPVSLPDGLKIKGASSTGSWLRGRITFGSNCVVRDIKLGDAGYSTRNGANASNTRFERCQFRGGGGTGYDAAVILVGGQYSCGGITFKDCNVERNLGVENGACTLGFNNISINEMGQLGGAHIENVTFDGCHIGVSNGAAGRNIGSPRAGLEATTSSSQGTIVHGWNNINIIDCIFEATNSFSIDLADFPLASGQRASGPALISGCTIMGGGYTNGTAPFGYSICLEAPHDVIIENNTIYRGYMDAIAVDGGSYIIRNNIIDLTYDNGITPEDNIYNFQNELTATGIVTGNTFTTNQAGCPLSLDGMSNGTVTGNTFIEQRSTGGAWPLVYKNCVSTTITGNTFRTAATSDAMNIMKDAGSNTNVTIAPNTYLHN